MLSLGSISTILFALPYHEATETRSIAPSDSYKELSRFLNFHQALFAVHQISHKLQYFNFKTKKNGPLQAVARFPEESWFEIVWFRPELSLRHR